MPRSNSPENAVVASSVKGENHGKRGICCQDAVAVRKGYCRALPGLIHVISDGHGGDAYVHSDRGSALAVQAAEQIATRFMLEAKGGIKTRQKQFEHIIRDQLRSVWISEIISSWPEREIPTDIVRKHGATLIMGVVFRNHLHIAQMGDGEVLVIDRAGKATFLEEPEEGPISTVVTSLCGKHSDRHWKFGCLPVRRIGFLMMSSDGLINSFASNSEYIRFARIIQDRLLRFPQETVQEALPTWLSDISKRGSGDDVSIIATTMNTTTNNKENNNEPNH